MREGKRKKVEDQYSIHGRLCTTAAQYTLTQGLTTMFLASISRIDTHINGCRHNTIVTRTHS